MFIFFLILDCYKRYGSDIKTLTSLHEKYWLSMKVHD